MSGSQLTFFGQDIENSTRVSMSIDLSSLTGSGGGGGGSGDITVVSHRRWINWWVFQVVSLL